MFRALRLGLLSQDQLDAYDPALMFTIPRLAIVWYEYSIVECFAEINSSNHINNEKDMRKRMRKAFERKLGYNESH